MAEDEDDDLETIVGGAVTMLVFTVAFGLVFALPLGRLSRRLRRATPDGPGCDAALPPSTGIGAAAHR